MWFPNRSNTNEPVQSQKQAEEGLYYPCSENKGADQLRGHREADLRLCFRLCRLLVFPCGGSFDPSMVKTENFSLGIDYEYELVSKIDKC